MENRPVPLLLSERDVRAVLPMADLVEAMEQALVAYSAGQVAQPVRPVIEVGPERNYFAVMPAAMDSPAAVGAKVVTVFHRNHERGLTSHMATILLLDPETGGLVALMDGRYITEARTAAVSAVSVKHLARPDADVLGIVGSGVQARSHLEAIRLVRPLREVRVWSPNAAHREAFVQEMSEVTGLSILGTSSAAEAVRDASIVVIATASPEPVVSDSDIAQGTHIAAVGACRPDQREMPAALIARATLFVDSREAALQESGDILLAIKDGAVTEAHFAGEIGEVVSGRKAGRPTSDAVTIFKSLGMAVEDVVAARLVVDRATRSNIGTRWSDA